MKPRRTPFLFLLNTDTALFRIDNVVGVFSLGRTSFPIYRSDILYKNTLLPTSSLSMSIKYGK